MPEASEHFNLDAFLQPIGQAFTGLTCHICFDAAWHGLIIAALVALSGLILHLRGQRIGLPMLSVSRKIAIFCVVMIAPGLIYYLNSHQLPGTGAFHISSLGFIIFWSWISLHLSAEEMNFEWF